MVFNLRTRTIVKYIALVFLGALAGFFYWRFIGCATGTCPIKSNPFMMTGYGALIGLLIATLIRTEPKKKQSEDE